MAGVSRKCEERAGDGSRMSLKVLSHSLRSEGFYPVVTGVFWKSF